MADIFTRAKRSEVMARIRGRGNKKTELVLMRLFRENGITGWRRHLPLPGRPDFAFPKYKLAVFVDGCFWHACPEHGSQPRSNAEYWTAKLDANRARDKRVNQELRAEGWSVIRLWEHDLRKQGRMRAVERVVRALERVNARS